METLEPQSKDLASPKHSLQMAQKNPESKGTSIVSSNYKTFPARTNFFSVFNIFRASRLDPSTTARVSPSLKQIRWLAFAQDDRLLGHKFYVLFAFFAAKD